MAERTTADVKNGFLQEMERLRTADLGELHPNVSFHLGYLNSVVYELLCRVEAMEAAGLGGARQG